MKKMYFLISLLMLAFSINAQYIYNDFDDNQNEPFNGWPNAPTLIANPDASGINTSPQVAEWIRTSEQWAHVYCELDGKIDFSTVTAFTLKVHVPITCTILFKIEDKANSGVFTELSTDVTTINEWIELNFDFTEAESDLYDKIVIFFDFATTTDNTFYFDDVTGPEYDGGSGPKPLLALDVQDNFENDGWGTINTWKFQDPDLLDLTIVTDPVNADNHVAEYNRSGNFEWTNAQFILDHRMDLSARNIFDIKVYFPSTNDYSGALTPTAAIKLQNSLLGGNAWTTQTEIKLTVDEFDTWVSLSFDFSIVSDSVNYDQVVVQFGGETHFIPGMFYFDDLKLRDINGIGKQTMKNIDVFPNPASDVLYVENIEDIVSLKVYSMNGNLIRESHENVNSIDLKNVPAGFYTLIINGWNGQIYYSKFIVK